ncbi:MAG: DUF11 domain-containing protein [Armatimonadetes bacterium]|nr:MAG: DUF11 domain-containing protein [Armatimonadota bacterium]
MPQAWISSTSTPRRLLSVVIATLLILSALAFAPGISNRAEAAPPGFPTGCGLDFLVILDESGSIGTTSGAEAAVTNAFDVLVTSLMGTESSVRVMDFNTNANLWGNGWVDTVSANQGTFDTYIDSYNPGGWTNWEDAMRLGHYSNAASQADVVLFITDGNPTALVDRDDVSQVTYETGSSIPTGDMNTNQSPSNAFDAAYNDPAPDGGDSVGKLVKGETYVWGIGVGDAFSSASARGRLADISDASTLVDFDELADTIRQSVFEGCENTLQITKTVSPPEGDDYLGSGYDFSVEVSVNGGAFGATSPGSDSTNGSGIAGPFAWTTNSEADTADLRVTETSPGDVGGFLTGASCTWRTVTENGDATVSFTPGNSFFDVEGIPANALVECDVTNDVPPAPSLVLEKDTASIVDTDDNGIDAGDEINYTFEVTNDGNVTLYNVDITDEVIDADVVGDPIPSLAPGASDSTTFTATYVITQQDMDRGTFTNCATATAVDGEQGEVTSNRPCETNTFDKDPGLELEKATASIDDGGDGVDAGDTINYTFTVTNTGNVTLRNVDITDEVIDADVVGDPIPALAPGESDSTTFTATYVITQADIEAGSFENCATATANGDVTSNRSCETNTFEQDPDLTLVKTTASIDDGGDGADAGDTINYAFEVTNTGNVTLTNVDITDLMAPDVVVTGAPIPSLAPGASDSTTFTATYVITQADIEAGSFENCAIATATWGQNESEGGGQNLLAAAGPVVSNESCTIDNFDEKSITIDKLVWDGDSYEDSAVLVPGATPTWQITVSNPSLVTVSGISLSDPVAPLCETAFAAALPGGSLAAGGSVIITCTGPAVEVGSTVNVATASGNGVLSVDDDATVRVAAVQASGVIGDRVWYDLDDDGIQDASEVGIPGATVRITGLDGQDVDAATAGIQTSMTMVTGTDGKYLFSALPAGNYKVDTQLSWIPDPEAVGLRFTTPSSFTIALADGGENLTADFGVVSDELPHTGLDADKLLIVAILLMIAGAGAVLATRRRKDNGEDLAA